MDLLCVLIAYAGVSSDAVPQKNIESCYVVASRRGIKNEISPRFNKFIEICCLIIAFFAASFRSIESRTFMLKMVFQLIGAVLSIRFPNHLILITFYLLIVIY